MNEEKILKAILLIADSLEPLGSVATQLKVLVGEVTGVSEFPHIDVRAVENDKWMSWKKDEKGLCSFPAEEGHAGWIRISKAGNTVLTLAKAMKQQGLEKVTLALFEYKLSGDDFLQRRPLQKPTEDPHAKMQRSIENVKKAGEALTKTVPRDQA